MITYDHIKIKQISFRNARDIYVKMLRDVAIKLKDTYINSLELPSENWINLQGEKYPYVFVEFDIVEGVNDELEKISIDCDKGISFYLFTVTDDNPCNPLMEKIKVSINVSHDGKIEISINCFKNKIFSSVDSQEKICEICEFMKNCILLSMTAVSNAACKPTYHLD